MLDITNSVYKIRFLDELSHRNIFINNINPLVKLIVSIVYIVITLSFDKYEIIGMLPLIFYPIIIYSQCDIPPIPILKRIIIVLPVVLGLGIFNPILERDPIILYANITISSGWISYLSLIMKSLLTVNAALLLISTTSIDRIAKALSRLHVPNILVMQLLFTYRYIYVLLEEVVSILTAYTLRAPGQGGIHYKSWGPLLGQLLIRSYDRSQRIYYCMALRGFNGKYHKVKDDTLRIFDYVYLFMWTVFFIFIKLYNLPVLLGKIILGVN